MPHINVPSNPFAPTSVIEVNSPQPLPEFLGQSAEENLNIVRGQVMNASGTCRAARELDSPYAWVESGHSHRAIGSNRIVPSACFRAKNVSTVKPWAKERTRRTAASMSSRCCDSNCSGDTCNRSV